MLLPSTSSGFLRAATDDDDGDGLTNLQEYLAGTDPHDPASRLALGSASFLPFPL